MYKVEEDFEYNGLRCVVVFTSMGHRCGYVGVDKNHILYGKDYNDYLEINKEEIQDKPMPDAPLILMQTALDDDERIRIDAYFDCHGGITHSNGGERSKYPIESDLWWFGFDCAHYMDGKELNLAMEYFPSEKERLLRVIQYEGQWINDGEIRSKEYVKKECIKLAEQLIIESD